MKFPRLAISFKYDRPIVMKILFVIEFFLTAALLTLYGLEEPNTFRSKLWQNGYDKGFNSAPNVLLYAAANYRPIGTPAVWSTFLIEFDIAIAVLSMFILLVKSVMFVLHAFFPLLSIFAHGVLVAVYAVSIHLQTAPDLADPQHINRGLPWFLSQGCSYAEPGNYGYCMQARAEFGLTCVMVAIFSIYFLFACWNLRLNPEEREARKLNRELDIELERVGNPDMELAEEELWEKRRQVFMNMPRTPAQPSYPGGMNPMTPRTTAFNKLEGSSNHTASGALRTTRDH